MGDLAEAEQRKESARVFPEAGAEEVEDIAVEVAGAFVRGSIRAEEGAPIMQVKISREIPSQIKAMAAL